MSTKQEHNAVFYKSLSNQEAAKDYFRQNLPKPLLDAIDLNSLKLCSSSFFHAELNAKHTDVLYRFTLNSGDNHVYMLYVLSEHQSIPLEIMPLRVLKYEVSIMNRHWESFGKIPLVHSIVYYNGKSP